MANPGLKRWLSVCVGCKTWSSAIVCIHHLGRPVAAALAQRRSQRDAYKEQSLLPLLSAASLLARWSFHISSDWLVRLCRPALRKGSAFPGVRFSLLFFRRGCASPVEAQPQPNKRIVAQPGKAEPFRKAGRRSRFPNRLRLLTGKRDPKCTNSRRELARASPDIRPASWPTGKRQQAAALQSAYGARHLVVRARPGYFAEPSP